MKCCYRDDKQLPALSVREQAWLVLELIQLLVTSERFSSPACAVWCGVGSGGGVSVIFLSVYAWAKIHVVVTTGV